jgi:hypothetical protein
MARIRTIKPEFVESESIGKLSRDARLLFVLLWTLVDDAGRARASSRFLASRLYPYDDDAQKKIGGWLEELELGGHVRLYEVDGDQYLDIPKWLKHQKIDHPSLSRLPEFREGSRDLASTGETIAPHTLDLGPVPRTEDLGSFEGADAPRPPKPAKSGTRIPTDWRPTDAGRSYASDRGLDPDSTADAFVDWWKAANGPNAIKRDWDAAFRTWCRRDTTGRVGRPPTGSVPPARGGGAYLDQLAIIASRDDADERDRR